MPAKNLLIAFCVTAISISTFAQTYPIGWQELINTSVGSGNSIYKNGGITDWDAGAASSNMLPSNTDGYLQWTYATTVQYYMAGLSRNNTSAGYSTIDFALYVAGGNVYCYENNVYGGALTTVVAGDILKVGREGTNVKYYKNGTVIRTTAISTVLQGAVLRVDCSLYHVGVSIPTIVASFDKTIKPQPSFTFPSLVNNNDGGIVLVPEGGDGPYQYLWNTGETTASISAKSRGTYSVTITDASNRQRTATYYLGYPIGWGNLSNVTLNANASLTRIGPGAWAAGAFSRNKLETGQDGYFEFVLNDINLPFVVGYSSLDRTNNYPSINGGIAINELGNTAIYSNGTVITSNIAGVMKSDVIRVARVGTNIVFSKNGVSLYTLAIGNGPLFVDISLQNSVLASPVFTSDFQMKPIFKPTFTFPNSSNTNGAITLNAEGAYPPASYSWSPGGETTANIAGKSRGTYTLTYNDAALHAATKTFRLGYPIMWTDLQNAVLNADNTVSQTAGVAWTAGAISGNKLDASTDGWVEWIVPASGGTVGIGLGRQNNLASPSGIDYCFYLVNGSDLRILENAADRGLFATVYEGDVITITREGSNIKYMVNGVVVRTLATTPTWELYVDMTFNGWNIPSPITQCSFNRTPQTFYSRANGNWNAPSTWSLTDGGPAATNYPVQGDVANVKGFNVSVTSAILAPTININAIDNQTALIVDGSAAILSVKGAVNVQGTTNANAQTALIVKNQGKITVNP